MARARAGHLIEAVDELFAEGRRMTDPLAAVMSMDLASLAMKLLEGKIREARKASRHNELAGLTEEIRQLRAMIESGSLPAVAPVPALPAPPVVPAKPLASSLVDEHLQRRIDVDGSTRQVNSQERTTLRLFRDILGDRPIDTYARSDITRLLDALRRLPTTYGKSPADAQRSYQEIVDRADQAGADRISDKTVKRHLSALSQFFQFAVDRGYLTATAKGDALNDHSFRASDEADRDQRDAWTSNELKALFSSPLWTGCHPHFRTQEGPEIIRDAYYWIPLICTYQGSRLEEIADLHGRDVFRDGNIWAIRITASTIEYGDVDNPTERKRRLKNSNAKRVVPIHPALIEIGLLAHIQRTVLTPDAPLFPELELQGADFKRGPRLTRWFVNYRKRLNIYREGVGMHAFRHVANTRLRDVITDWQQERHVAYLLGHSQGGGEGRERYDKGPALAAAAETLALLRYPEIDLDRLKG